MASLALVIIMVLMAAHAQAHYRPRFFPRGLPEDENTLNRLLRYQSMPNCPASFKFGALSNTDVVGDFERKLCKIECPVCSGSTFPAECPVVENGKKYMVCQYGYFFNQICEHVDCFAGPNELCTVGTNYLAYDNRGKECAPGLACLYGKCVGMARRESLD